MRLTPVVTLCLLLTSLQAPVGATETSGAADGSSAISLFPDTSLYAPYVADPHRTGFGLEILGVADRSIPASSGVRFRLSLGGRFGLLAFRPEWLEGWRSQLVLEAGFTGQFDIEESLDSIGWDGVYGLQLEARRPDGLALKVGTRHVSSHLGDEYAERTGRRRIGYTREEILAAVSWRPRTKLRAYAEAGWAYGKGNDTVQEEGRAQVGLEYTSVPRPEPYRWTWYAAVDVSAAEEREWKVNPSIHLGFALRTGKRDWRVGIGYAHGRVPIGELSFRDEGYVVLGLWLDV